MLWAMQVYELSSMHFLPKDWIMERWEEGFYITAMAGSAGGSSLVVMSKGTPYTQQSYKVGAPHSTSGKSRSGICGHLSPRTDSLVTCHHPTTASLHAVAS